MDKGTLIKLGFDFDKETGTLNLPPDDKKLNVPRRIFAVKIKHLGDYLFSQRNYEEVYIPTSVESIGVGTFSSNKLRKLHIPGNVKSIGNFCFYSNKLETVYLSEGVETVGNEAFATNYYLKEVYIPPSVTSLGEGIFDDTTDELTIVCVEGSYAHEYAERGYFTKVLTLEEYNNVTI